MNELEIFTARTMNFLGSLYSENHTYIAYPEQICLIFGLKFQF
jgi:hypothetical protein